MPRVQRFSAFHFVRSIVIPDIMSMGLSVFIPFCWHLLEHFKYKTLVLKLVLTYFLHLKVQAQVRAELDFQKG